MSIDIVIRPAGASSGGENRQIAEGTGTIDTPAEAAAALAMIANTGNVIVVPNDPQPFDQARLMSVISGGGAAGTPGATVQNCPAGSRRLGSVGTSEHIPAQTIFSLFIDGNPVRFYDVLNNGTPLVTQMTLVADRRPPICVPLESLQRLQEGEHNEHTVQFRYIRPNRAPLYVTQRIPFTPPIATLSNASVLPPTPVNSSFARQPIQVRFNTSMAAPHSVRISIGGNTQVISVPGGAAGREFTATLPGEPRSWPVPPNVVPDRRGRYTVPVTVTALGNPGPNQREGTPVPAGNVTITRARTGSGGGHRTPPPPPPRGVPIMRRR